MKIPQKFRLFLYYWLCWCFLYSALVWLLGTHPDSPSGRRQKVLFIDWKLELQSWETIWLTDVSACLSPPLFFSPTNFYPRKCVALVQRREGKSHKKNKNIQKAMRHEFLIKHCRSSYACRGASIPLGLGGSLPAMNTSFKSKGRSYTMSLNFHFTEQGVSTVQLFAEMSSYKTCKVVPQSWNG